MKAHEIVKALLVRRDGISVKAARMIAAQAEEIERLKHDARTNS